MTNAIDYARSVLTETALARGEEVIGWFADDQHSVFVVTDRALHRAQPVRRKALRALAAIAAAAVLGDAVTEPPEPRQDDWPRTECNAHEVNGVRLTVTTPAGDLLVACRF